MGIDIHVGTGPVDLQKVKDAGHSFVICKATEGSHYKDSAIKAWFATMKELDMIRGAYHFFHVGVDINLQAENFINQLEDIGYDKINDLPPILDLEDRAGTTEYGVVDMRIDVSEWLKIIQNEFGVMPIIYMDFDFAQNLLGSGWQGHELWLAEYTSETPKIPKPWTSYLFWQYSESGSVPGCPDGVVDMDHYNGSEAELRQWIKNIHNLGSS